MRERIVGRGNNHEGVPRTGGHIGGQFRVSETDQNSAVSLCLVLLFKHIAMFVKIGQRELKRCGFTPDWIKTCVDLYSHLAKHL